MTQSSTDSSLVERLEQIAKWLDADLGVEVNPSRFIREAAARSALQSEKDREGGE